MLSAHKQQEGDRIRAIEPKLCCASGLEGKGEPGPAQKAETIILPIAGSRRPVPERLGMAPGRGALGINIDQKNGTHTHTHTEPHRAGRSKHNITNALGSSIAHVSVAPWFYAHSTAAAAAGTHSRRVEAMEHNNPAYTHTHTWVHRRVQFIGKGSKPRRGKPRARMHQNSNQMLPHRHSTNPDACRGRGGTS